LSALLIETSWSNETSQSAFVVSVGSSSHTSASADHLLRTTLVLSGSCSAPIGHLNGSSRTSEIVGEALNSRSVLLWRHAAIYVTSTVPDFQGTLIPFVFRRNLCTTRTLIFTVRLGEHRLDGLVASSFGAIRSALFPPSKELCASPPFHQPGDASS
jgi:hypothetical protein